MEKTNSKTTMPAMLPAVPENVVSALDEIASNKALSAASQFQRAFAMAGAIGQLRALMTPDVMKNVMALQNNALGFMTDRKEAPYDEGTVRDALIEAILSGVSPVGNEFNIISGRCYLTKNGMKHKLRDIDGLSFSVTPGLPKHSGDSGAALLVAVDWTYQGKTEHKDLPIAVRVNARMGVDAILGKAMRKAYAWLYETVTGQNVNEGDVTDDAKAIELKAEPAAAPIVDAETVTAEPEKREPEPKDGELPM